MIFIEYFIAGMLFVYVVTPLLDGIVSLILSGIDVLKGKLNVSLTKAAVNIQKLKDSLEEDPPRNPIGFRPPDDEDEEAEND